MSVVKSTFRNGNLLNRKVIAEFGTYKEAETFCEEFADTHTKEGWLCVAKNNGWTVSEPICIPGWIMNGVEYAKVFSLKIIDSNPLNEVMSELQSKILSRSSPIDIPTL